MFVNSVVSAAVSARTDPVLGETRRLKNSGRVPGKVGGKIAALYILDSDVDSLGNSRKEVLISTAEAVLARQRKKIQPWVTRP